MVTPYFFVTSPSQWWTNPLCLSLSIVTSVTRRWNKKYPNFPPSIKKSFLLWANPSLFLFIFGFSSWHNSNIIWKNHIWCYGTWTWGGRMENADKYTELWWHPKVSKKLTQKFLLKKRSFQSSPKSCKIFGLLLLEILSPRPLN